MNTFKINWNGWWNKNCKTQRKKKTKICQLCPFREYIENQEKERTK